MVSVTMIKAGEAHNVTMRYTAWPGEALRALRLTTFEHCTERLQSILMPSFMFSPSEHPAALINIKPLGSEFGGRDT
jgi:hypothetical protein